MVGVGELYDTNLNSSPKDYPQQADTHLVSGIQPQDPSYITLPQADLTHQYLQIPQSVWVTSNDGSSTMDLNLNSEATLNVPGTSETESHHIPASETDKALNMMGTRENQLTDSSNEHECYWGPATFDTVGTSHEAGVVVKRHSSEGKVLGKEKVGGKSNPSIVKKCRTNYKEGIPKVKCQIKVNQVRITSLEKEVYGAFKELKGLFYPSPIPDSEFSTALLLKKATENLAKALEGNAVVKGFRGDAKKARLTFSEVLQSSDDIFSIPLGSWSQYYHMILENIISYQNEVIKYHEMELEEFLGLIAEKKKEMDQPHVFAIMQY